MSVPFASAYGPINTLNDAIMAQAQQAQVARLAQQQMDNQGVNEAMNRIIQQRAIQQQGEAQRQHYGLQQAQLANDLAYRNAALAQQRTQQAEVARQFDKTYGLNEKIANAQIGNPFFGAGKDFAAYGLQAGQDANKYNQEADGAATELNRIQKQLAVQHELEVKSIKENDHWYKGPPLAEKLMTADKAYSDALLALKLKVPGGEKTRFNPISGDFEALRMTPPQFGRPQPSSPSVDGVEAPTVSSTPQGTPEGPGQGTGEGSLSNPFLKFSSGGGAPEITAQSGAGFWNRVGQNIARSPINPFSYFGIGGGTATNAPSALVVQPVPAARATEGVHFRTNADGSVIVLTPILRPDGKVYPVNSILPPLR